MLGSSSAHTRLFSRAYREGEPGPVATRHGMRETVRPLAGFHHQPLLLSGRGGIVPSGPVMDRFGRRLPGGVGTDLTDPSTWRRRYAFPGGNYPQIQAKQHFT